MKTKLCDIADIHPGYPFRGSITPDKNGDVHVVQLRDAQVTGEIVQDEMIKTILTGKKQPDWLQSGDILFVAKGATNLAALVEDIPEKTVCSPHFFLIRIKPEFREKVSTAFICWQLNQIPTQRYFQSTAEGSLYLSIRRPVLEDTPIVMLPLIKQNTIAALHRCAVQEQKVLQQLIHSRKQQLDAIALSELV